MAHNTPNRQVIYDDISSVVAPDTRPDRGYQTGESAWIVISKKGTLLSVTTRRIPKHLRWTNQMINDYFGIIYG